MGWLMRLRQWWGGAPQRDPVIEKRVQRLVADAAATQQHREAAQREAADSLEYLRARVALRRPRDDS
jgi:hypothetical protein